MLRTGLLLTGKDMNYSVEMIWKTFNEPLERFIRRRVPDEDMAADLLQDVYVKIHTNMDTLRDTDRLQSWIYQIARNTVYDYYRTRKAHLEIPEELAMPDADDDTSARLAEGLRSMIEELPDEYQVALRLTELEGLTQQELAARTGLSLSGAKSRVQRGRKMLREMLLACCHFEFDRHGKVIDYYPECQCCSEVRCAN
jgi:RNA polymerase sigma-70 factor (ECF subfamily)